MEAGNKKFAIVIGVLAAAGGLAAFFSWLENRKTNAIREEVLHLDKQIKELELSNLKARIA